MYGFKFTMEGDFAHFRDPSTQQTLETYIGPPRSAVIGILSAALGKQRGHTKEVSQKVNIGMLVENIGGWRKEIVTLHNLKYENLKQPSNTKYLFEYLQNNTGTPTLRKSITNPRYTIAVTGENKSYLETLRKGLKSPQYPLYLGINEYLAWIKSISGIESIQAKKGKEFSCFVPSPGNFTSCLWQGYSVSPTTVHVPKLTYTENGEHKAEFMNLLMQYNSKIVLEEEKLYYKIDGEKFITF